MSRFDAHKEAKEIADVWGDAAERVAIRKARWSAEEGDYEGVAQWWEIQQAIRTLRQP